LGLEPVLLLKTVKGGIEGTLRDLKEIPGNLLDALGDGVAVKGPAATILRISMSRVPLRSSTFS